MDWSWGKRSQQTSKGRKWSNQHQALLSRASIMLTRRAAALITRLLAEDSLLEYLRKLMSTIIAPLKNFSPAKHFTRLAH